MPHDFERTTLISGQAHAALDSELDSRQRHKRSVDNYSPFALSDSVTANQSALGFAYCDYLRTHLIWRGLCSFGSGSIPLCHKNTICFSTLQAFDSVLDTKSQGMELCFTSQ